MIKYEQIQRLVKYTSTQFPITSLHLNTDGAKRTPKEIVIIFKELVNQKKKELGKLGYTTKQIQSVERDLKTLTELITERYVMRKFKGVSVFVSTGNDFYEVFELPRAPRDVLVVDFDPYIRPLIAILEEYSRYGVLLVDKAKAQFFEIFAGEIEEHAQMETELPRVTARVPGFASGKEVVPIPHHGGRRGPGGGQYGFDERHIERRLEKRFYEHLQRVNEYVFKVFMRDRFDYLIIGTHAELRYDVESMLHSYLKRKLVGWLPYGPEATVKKVLEDASKIIKRVTEETWAKMVDELISEVSKDGLAVVGLEDTVKAVNYSAARTILVDENFKKEGFICPKCGFLSVEMRRCEFCDEELIPIVDIVDELVETAITHGTEIHHIEGNEKLAQNGYIGAFLRFKI